MSSIKIPTVVIRVDNNLRTLKCFARASFTKDVKQIDTPSSLLGWVHVEDALASKYEVKPFN